MIVLGTSIHSCSTACSSAHFSNNNPTAAYYSYSMVRAGLAGGLHWMGRRRGREVPALPCKVQPDLAGASQGSACTFQVARGQ